MDGQTDMKVEIVIQIRHVIKFQPFTLMLDFHSQLTVMHLQAAKQGSEEIPFPNFSALNADQVSRHYTVMLENSHYGTSKVVGQKVCAYIENCKSLYETFEAFSHCTISISDAF